MSLNLDLSKPRWPQDSFVNRYKHFFSTVNPTLVFASNKQLDDAKALLDQYKKGTAPKSVTEEELWRAKNLYDSAFHPDTGEKVFLPGRMAFQVPGNMMITGCMMAFYRSTPAVIFWQWANQSFNAIVNYSNRNATSPVTNELLAKAYCAATSASVVVAVGLNRIVARSPSLRNSFFSRLVPFVAVAAANYVNLPLMRVAELQSGIDVQTDKGEVLGKSTNAAWTAINLVVPGRILMACPGMICTPLIVSRLERTPLFTRMPVLTPISSVLVMGFFLTFATPAGCAVAPQWSSLKTDQLEEPLRSKVKAKGVSTVYYNKGL